MAFKLCRIKEPRLSTKMKHTNRNRITMKAAPITALILTFVATSAPAFASGVTLSALPGLGRLFGVNSSAQIVGYTIGGEGRKGLVYTNGTVRTLVVPGSFDTAFFGIEDSGKIVGSYADASGTHGLLYAAGAFTPIDVPGSRGTIAHGINNAGTIVGTFTDNSGHQNGFILSGNQFTTITAPSSVNTTLNSINNFGFVAGSFTSSDGHEKGFLFDGRNSFTTIAVPGATDTFLGGLNNFGIAVGSFIDSKGTHGFVYFFGIYIPFDAPGTPSNFGTFAHGINDLGQLSAFGIKAFLGNFIR